MRLDSIFLQFNLLYSMAPTVTPYPVASSLSLKENFIFFLVGSDEALVPVRVKKGWAAMSHSLSAWM